MTSCFDAGVAQVRSGADPGAVADGLIGELTDDELLWLLDGDSPLLPGMVSMAVRYNAEPMTGGRIDRLGIPGIRFTDGPRGVVLGASTAFPVALGRAAAWDPQLEQQVGDAIGKEARAQGANLFAGICVNLAPFPGWGRSQESYGEEPLLLGQLGAALHRGVAPWVMSCVKHYACNSMEQARFVVDVEVDDAVLHEVYLPHFRLVVEAGADCVMSAYNQVNGQWAGQHEYLLTEVLRREWGFEGFVMTDFLWGLRDPVVSVTAGQDLEMPFRQQRAAALPAALREGRLDHAQVVASARRLLATQLRWAARALPVPDGDVVACQEHRELARRSATRSLVLLRNDGLLPLTEAGLGSVAVLGALADRPNLGDHGSSRVRPPQVRTILDGLRERLGDRVLRTDDPAVAARADVAVVVVGLGARDEGEFMLALDGAATRAFGGPTRWPGVARVVDAAAAIGRRLPQLMGGGDRRDLRLPARDVALIEAVAKANPRTVVVVIGGGTIVVDPWDATVAAVLLAWYPGMEGGLAVADVLLGNSEPGGRLPLAVPHRKEDLPVVDWQARRVRYPRFWGQRALDRQRVAAAYPLGFGLGYTTFELSDLRVGKVTGEAFEVTVRVSNTGGRDGRDVLQVYGRRPERALLGFASVAVGAGQHLDVPITCSTRPLQRWDRGRFICEEDRVVIEAARFSGDPAALVGDLRC